LWKKRDATLNLHIWLRAIYDEILSDLIRESRTARDEVTIVEAFIARTAQGGDSADMTLGQFSGDGEGNDRIKLSTLHSAKGREFRVVILFAMDKGRIPRNGATPGETREARRLFYVGFTRPEDELHIAFTASRPSPFVTEVQQRMESED
jgi:superfamily I DNA/RNA helicase